MNPQPPAGDPAWRGNDPADGTVYQHTCPFLDGVDGLNYPDWQFITFVPAAEDPLMALVEEAIELLPFGPADIHIAPDPAGAGLVWLPVWMWTPETETTWNPEPVTLTAPTFGVTLTATATVEAIWWDMGDGTEPVRCDTPGTPYETRYGVVPSPDCGHVYEETSRTQPDGRYTVTATTEWLVEWDFVGIVGMGGQETFEREASTSVEINELQVLSAR